jgi:hypothetical protein
MVRLNPRIFTSGESTHTYIEKKASEARKLLSTFYLDVEKVYTDTIRRMRVIE